MLGLAHLVLVVTSGFGRIITWRGIRYRLQGPHHTEILSRPRGPEIPEAQEASVRNRFVSRVEERVYQHRARWTLRHLAPFVRPGDRVLDVGAGDCRLDELLQRRLDCEVIPVDVADYNRTSLPLTLFDGQRLPFADDSFDVVLLVFVLHHAADAAAVLAEARRVARRVVVFEDVNRTRWDRWMFRGFHRWLEWSQNIPRPYREWSPDRWSELAAASGLREQWHGLVGRQLSFLAPRHMVFVWDKAGAARTVRAIA